jgi:germination protein M
MLLEAAGMTGEQAATGQAGMGGEQAAAGESEMTPDKSAEPVFRQPKVNNEVPAHAVTVYLRDAQGYLAPITVRLEGEEEAATESVQSLAEAAITWLTQDAQRKSRLPEGFDAVLPGETKLASMQLDTDSGTAVVAFEELPVLPAKIERQAIEAIVWTLTEIPGLERVKLTVKGKPVRSLPTSGLPVEEVLTRGFGINVEQAQGVNLSRSMGVTLYFAAQSPAGDGYFVPVTRLVERRADRVRIAMDELNKGPADRSLQPVLLPGISVEQLTHSPNAVQISLLKEGWNPDQPVPSSMMEALVLTMTEAANVPAVKVAINGSDAFVDSDQRAYDRPVTRPIAVNVLKR